MADQNHNFLYRQTIIIGSGVSGLSAAFQLHKAGLESVLILEGRDRVGGRILTEYLDEDTSMKPLEMGACWMHGLHENPVYELAQREKFPAHTGTILNFDIGTCVDENGNHVRPELHEEVDKFFEELAQDARDIFLKSQDIEGELPRDKQWLTASFQNVFSEKFQNFLNQKKGSGGADEDEHNRRLKTKLLQRRFDQETGECGCQSMDQVSYYEFGSYQRPKGPDMEFPCGYSTLIRYLRSNIPQTWLNFNTLVENITWKDGGEEGRVKITCANGKLFECDHLIVTIPLACLKWNYKSLFTPALPPWKTEAINKLDMGTVDKVYMFYDKPIDFIKGDSLAVVYDRKFETLDIKKEWYKKIFLFQKVYDNVLLGWITGDEAIYCEALDEIHVGSVLTDVFRKSLKNPIIPLPKKVVRTQWFSDPCSKGSYSYVPVGASSRIHIRDLAKPLLVNNMPRVLFAGEATHLRYYSTVTGAFITGQTQAQNLVHYLEQSLKNDAETLAKSSTSHFTKIHCGTQKEPP